MIACTCPPQLLAPGVYLHAEHSLPGQVREYFEIEVVRAECESHVLERMQRALGPGRTWAFARFGSRADVIEEARELGLLMRACQP